MNLLTPNLPKSPNFRGFTLVELMVVISIVAILAVVGFSVFSGTQKNARDGRRRSEIDSIAKSVETMRNLGAATTSYNYSAANYTSDMKSITDPSLLQYCIIYPVPAGDIGITSAPTATTCPNSYVAMTAAAMTNQPSWKVCTWLEATGAAYCKSNLF